jgi:hypothetical protein
MVFAAGLFRQLKDLTEVVFVKSELLSSIMHYQIVELTNAETQMRRHMYNCFRN